MTPKSARRREGGVAGPAVGWVLVAALINLPVAVAGQPGAMAPDHGADHHHHPMPAGVQRSEASYPIPDVTLLDQSGRQVDLRQLLAADKPVLVNFVYTTCTAICPVMTATFAQVQQRLGADAEKVMMVSFSIDPEQDTPAALAVYAQRFHAGPQWLFLTGSLEDSIAVQKAFDAYRGDKMNHVPLTFLRAARDGQWVRVDGFASADDLVKEARTRMRH